MGSDGAASRAGHDRYAQTATPAGSGGAGIVGVVVVVSTVASVAGALVSSRTTATTSPLRYIAGRLRAQRSGSSARLSGEPVAGSTTVRSSGRRSPSPSL